MMIRPSSYIIYVDLPDNDEEVLVVQGYTGAYDLVSGSVATYLRSLEARCRPTPRHEGDSEPPFEGTVEVPSERALEILRTRGYLTEKTVGEEEAFVRELALKIHERERRKMPSYVLMPTYNCNLRCRYCYQEPLRTDDSRGHLLQIMTPEVVDKIFAAMPVIEALHGVNGDGTEPRSITFYGGEPLLAANRPMITSIIAKALAAGSARFSAISNATELHAYEDLLSPEKLSFIQVTLDGAPAGHDQRRIYANGSGTFAQIARNLTMALEREVTISVRINVDRNNLHELPELATEIQRRGWDRFPRFGAYVSPIRAENENVEVRTTMSTWELAKKLFEMKEEFPSLSVIGSPDDRMKDHVRRLFQNAAGVQPDFRESYCGAHEQMYIFDLFADIYVCWHRTGSPGIRIGRIRDDGGVEFHPEAEHLWRSRTVASNPVCSKCRFAFLCGGGCGVLAEAKTGDLHMNHCDNFASRFRGKIAEAYVEHISGKVPDTKPTLVCDD